MQGLKKQILSLNLIFQGTIIKQFKQCGKKNCRCHQDKEYWHGPYWIWTRKEKGKTVTKTLKNKKQVNIVENGFKNIKKINRTLEKWKKQSLKLLEEE